MPNVNLSDARMRDAVVKAESTRQRRTIFYQGPKKLPAYTPVSYTHLTLPTKA